MNVDEEKGRMFHQSMDTCHTLACTLDTICIGSYGHFFPNRVSGIFTFGIIPHFGDFYIREKLIPGEIQDGFRTGMGGRKIDEC